MSPDPQGNLRHVNGIRLHVVEAGPPDGTPVILLHGFPEYWGAWRGQIGPLAQAGLRVIVPDLRGYNLSDASSGIRSYRLATLAADVLALAADLGHAHFAVVGHDWGGIIAWQVAATAPDRVRAAVIMNAPHPDITLPQIRRHPMQAFRSSYVLFFQMPWLPETMLRAGGFALLRQTMRGSARLGTFPDDKMTGYQAAWSRPGALTAMLNYYRALPFAPRKTGRVQPPVLILWGAQDQFLGNHLAEASLSRCDQGRLTLLPNATHWLHHEEPDRVSAEIAAFLTQDPGNN